MRKWVEIGHICNHYGSLYVKEENGIYYWSIENYDGFSIQEEISESLYNELIKHNERKDNE